MVRKVLEEVVVEEKVSKPRGRPKKDPANKVSRPKVSTQPRNERSKITRAKAIRLQCTECMNYQIGAIKDCPDVPCPLWPFRMGKGQEYTDTPIRKKR